MTAILAGAEPFFFEGDDRAVLFLHGFTGSTQSLRYVGEQLNKEFGLTVSGPLLKGHGTSPDDMETTTYLDWLASAEDALHDLVRRKKRVFVAGLSMGGTLSLNLAARFPKIVAGVIPINGTVGLLDGVLADVLLSRDAPARIPGIGSDVKDASAVELAYPEVPVASARQGYVLFSATGDIIHKISCPILVIQSREDHVVPPRNANAIVAGVGSSDIRLLWLENSYHVATIDYDKDIIVRRTGAFVHELSRVIN